MPHEDVHFQLIDLPAIAREHPVPSLVSTLQTADATLLVVDLGEQWRNYMGERPYRKVCEKSLEPNCS